VESESRNRGPGGLVVAVLKPYAAMWRKSSPRERRQRVACEKAKASSQPLGAYT
jgi:hypothetical protein